MAHPTYVHVGARQARRPKVVPKPRAPSPRKLGESSTQVPHGRASPRRSSRLLSKSEHALVCLVWALPCQVLSPGQNAMVQNCPSVYMVSRNAQHTQVFQAWHLGTLSLVLPWPQLGENPTLSPELKPSTTSMQPFPRPSWTPRSHAEHAKSSHSMLRYSYSCDKSRRRYISKTLSFAMAAMPKKSV